MSDEICEECLEYTCEHKFPELCIKEDCAICLDDMVNETMCFMGNCRHRYHRHCIEKACIYRETAIGYEYHAYECPLCKKNSYDLVSHKEYLTKLMNRFMPPIGSVPAFNYAHLYDENCYRMLPTEEMKKYVSDIKELYGIEYLKQLNGVKQPQTMTIKRSHW